MSSGIRSALVYPNLLMKTPAENGLRIGRGLFSEHYWDIVLNRIDSPTFTAF
ncbi:MAG: hypothetical protein VB674_05755 [Vicinamibacterales bacterium]